MENTTKQGKSPFIAVYKKIKGSPSFLLQIGLFLALFLFLLMPLIIMLFKLNGNDLKFVFSDKSFYESIKNSVKKMQVKTTRDMISHSSYFTEV